MADFLQTLTTAVTVGSLYALIALGYTMVYGILKLINFAHSDVVTLGAWASLTAGTFLLPRLGVDLSAATWWSGALVLLIAMLVCGLTGFLIERLAYRPLRHAPRLNALITAMGVSLFLQNAGQLQYDLVPSKVVVAKGTAVDRGPDAKSVVLDTPVTIRGGTAYAVSLRTAAGASVEQKVTADAGDYAAGRPLPVGESLGRSLFPRPTPATPKPPRPAFELMTVSTELKLPFGTQPAKTPAVLPKVVDGNVLYRRDFVSQVTQPDGTQRQVNKPFQLTLVDAAIVACTLLVMAGLEVLVFHTRLGTAMRAVSYNTDYAALMGIPIDRIIGFTFVLGSVLAAVAGFLYTQRYDQLNPTASYAWTLLGLKAFIAAVVGGIGNVRGAVAGAFLIAFIEQFGGLYATRYVYENASAYVPVAVFGLLIVVLLVKPSGLFGTTVREKV